MLSHNLVGKISAHFKNTLYKVFHNSRPREREETRDRIWMCNFEEKKSSSKDIREKTT
jgi:hypothetical protein